tara:strand:+ start:166191 stop:166718 length:528 start_codon:yes stop_codon:yes gene_type:complete
MGQPPHWYPADQHPQPPESGLIDWLCDQGSLTLRLTDAGANDFRVELLAQSSQPAREDEARALGLPPGEPVWVREVLLHTGGAPRVFARSVAPLAAISASNIDLQSLGSNSLGLLLFSNPDVSRGPLQISRYPSAWLPSPWREQAAKCWARRSHFSDGQLQLLVCEVFLPGWPQA